MNNASTYAPKLRGLLRRTRTGDMDGVPTDPLDQLIHAFLLWETTRRHADAAYSRLWRRMIDYNDLRVSDPTEIVNVIGHGYHLAADRAIRLHNALNAVYNREHGMDLSALKNKSKRDARAYLDSCEGMVPFVSASVLLLSLDGHAIPVDQQMVARLKNDGIIDPDATLTEIQAFLEHQFKASRAIKDYATLRNYVESPGGRTASRPAPRAVCKPVRKKSARRSPKKRSRRR